MSTPRTDAPSRARMVRAGLVAAARRRRLRDASRRVWQAAPLVAAVGLATAALARWAAWSPVVPLAVLAFGALALAAYVLLALGAGDPSDTVASAIDDEAGLGGELRSAGWFALRDQRDAWADLHVIRAAERLQRIDWATVYPAVRAPRSALMAAGLTVAAIAVSTMFRGLGPTSASAMLTTQPAGQSARGYAGTLPPELVRELERLLAAAEAGDRTAVRALSGNTALRDMLSQLADLSDRQLLEALAQALAPEAGAGAPPAEALDQLAERARRAAESTAMSAAMQDALEQLADELDIARPERAAGAGGPEEAPGDAFGGQGVGQDGAAHDLDRLTIQFADGADAGGSAGIMLFSNQDAADGGAPGAGAGGAPSTDVPASMMAEIEAAIGREVVAAHQDAPGASVDAERPRTTEQGSATASFTRSGAAAFDQSPAVAAPPVPEARRSGVRTYFVRPPQ